MVQKSGLSQCVLYGPGPLELAHQSDEYQPVADLKQAAKILALAILELLRRR